MNRTFKIETILYSKPINSKHHLHAIEASNRDGKQYLLLYLTHCKNLVAYIDDLAAVPVARVFEKDFFLLVENEDCYAYLVGDGNGVFILLFCKHLFSTYFPYYVRNKLFFSKNVPVISIEGTWISSSKKNIYTFKDITSSQKEMALMQLVSDAENSRNLLMQSQSANAAFIKNQPEST